MKNRFINLCKRLNIKTNSNESFFALSKAYSEPHRYYHNLEHIQNCLLELDEVKDKLDDPDAVELAIWYHDIIYDISSNSNEKNSAYFAYDFCLNGGMNEDFAKKVHKLIMATSHSLEVCENDEKYIVDIDLSILGSGPSQFLEYEKNIRMEYAEFSGEVFNLGRIKVLQSFLQRDQIFLTDYFVQKYELVARKNLQEAVQKLS